MAEGPNDPNDKRLRSGNRSCIRAWTLIGMLDRLAGPAARRAIFQRTLTAQALRAEALAASVCEARPARRSQSWASALSRSAIAWSAMFRATRNKLRAVSKYSLLNIVGSAIIFSTGADRTQRICGTHCYLRIRRPAWACICPKRICILLTSTRDTGRWQTSWLFQSARLPGTQPS